MEAQKKGMEGFAGHTGRGHPGVGGAAPAQDPEQKAHAGLLESQREAGRFTSYQLLSATEPEEGTGREQL